jgi:predicted metal-dependent hydrolase
MEKFIIFIVCFVLIISGFMYYDSMRNEVEYVKSNVDNNKYLVRKADDNQRAADLLAKIRYKLTKICKYCLKENPNNKAVIRMNKKFNPNNISETGKNSKYTSYSVNKGEKIVLCLRSRDGKDKLIDENTLTFVSIHELAHIMTKSVGHTEEFWKNFKYLLEKAIKLNLYKKENYELNPKPYCGITVTDSPLD